MYIRHTSFFLLILITLTSTTFAQDTVQWKNYVDTSKEIWFQSPAPILIDHNDELKGVTLYTFFEGFRVSVSKREINGEPMKYVKGLKPFSGLVGPKVRILQSETVYIRREDEKVGTNLRVTLQVGCKKSYFVINLLATPDNVAMKRFLETIRFDDSRLSVNKDIADKPVGGASIVFDTLPMSSLIKETLSRKRSGPEPVGKFGTVLEHIPNDLEKLSRDLIVLRKPRPDYPGGARKKGIQGTFLVNVQFLADGSIGNITVDDKADRSLGESAIKAARKIKFVPAEVDGKPVDTVRALEYSFSIY